MIEGMHVGEVALSVWAVAGGGALGVVARAAGGAEDTTVK